MRFATHTSTVVAAWLVAAGAAAPSLAQEKPAAAPKLSGTDANADYLTVRAAYEKLDALKSQEERKAGFDALKSTMAEYAKLYDGKVKDGPAYVALGFAQLMSGQPEKGQAIIDGYQKSLVGKPAPSLEVTKVLGGDASWSLEKEKGKVVLIDFWATWCPPCRGLIPSLVEMDKEYRPKGLSIVGATQMWGRGWLNGEPKPNLDDAAELKVNEDFKAALGMQYPIVFSKKNTGMFEWAVSGIPTVFLIDKSGKVRWIGGSGDHEEMKKKIDELLSEHAAQ
jgi:thiol-disulfide isomerase/thioredoxin